MSRRPKNGSQSRENLAEERIAKWKSNPERPEEYRIGKSAYYGKKALTLDLKGLGLKTVPESLRTIQHLELLDLENNNIQELP